MRSFRWFVEQLRNGGTQAEGSVVRQQGNRLALLTIASILSAAGAAAQPTPVGEVGLSLRKLNEVGAVLMIGAHPDDERTNVLAWFARGRHMRPAYLSINRLHG